MKLQDITIKADKYAKLMDVRGDTATDDKVIITAPSGSLEYNQLLDLTYKVNKETELSMDSTYRFTWDALQLFASVEVEDNDFESYLDDLIMDIEGDIYTNNLTAWLAESVNHVHYITEALEEYDEFKDGFTLLATAQAIAKQEVAHLVLEWLKEEKN